MATSKINTKASQNIFKKFEHMKPVWDEIIDKSFLSEEMKKRYKEMIELKLKILN